MVAARADLSLTAQAYAPNRPSVACLARGERRWVGYPEVATSTSVPSVTKAGRNLHYDYDKANWLKDQCILATPPAPASCANPTSASDQRVVTQLTPTGWTSSREQTRSRWAPPWRFLIGRAACLSVRSSQLDKGVVQVDGWWWMVVDAPDANQDDRKCHDDES